MADAEMNCGSAISDKCKDVKIPMTEAGWIKMVGEAVGSITFLPTAAAQMGAESMSLNMMKAVNAGRCAIVNFGDNGWNVIACLWFLAKQFGQEGEIKTLLDEYYPYVCTCKEDADKIAKSFGGNTQSQDVFNSCSEKAQTESQTTKKA